MYRSLLVSAVLTLAAPSTAPARGVAIRDVDVSGYPIIRVRVVTASPTTEAPTLRENGQSAADYQAVNLGREQSIILVLKHGQSMFNVPLGAGRSSGRPIANAIRATQTFVDAKPAADEIAVIAVASQALALSDLSTSTTDADDALSSIWVDPVYGTVEYDALVMAAAELRGHGLPGRSVVVVSDGLDTRSKATLAQAIEALRAARAAVYVVAIRSGAFSPRPLLALARRTGGSYYLAPSVDRLKQIYRRIGAELANTWQLQYATAARPGDTIRLTVRSGGATYTVAERLPGRSAPVDGSGPPTLLLVLIGLIGGLILVAVSLPKAARILSRLRA